AGLNELIVVASMHERKLEMAKRSDATMVLPGGFGTMDELFEMLTLSQLLRLQQPIGILNIGGFYDLMLQHLDHMLAMGFLKSKHRNLIYVDTAPEALFAKMKTYTPSGDIGKWANRN
ncbi:MAG: TIGR00730 family Rossman fold protein, partial [Saprospiraceae bacterium]|nr:TIGR00730 family Rossman fold protein [Saprospiraceae bacterium]